MRLPGFDCLVNNISRTAIAGRSTTGTKCSASWKMFRAKESSEYVFSWHGRSSKPQI